MSTIASPRPSFNSSRRTSTSTDTNTAHAPPTDRGSLRRNRAALRDYYGLQTNAARPPTDTAPAPSLDAEASALDSPTFHPDTYVTTLLSTQNLEAILKVEAGLVSEIRTLDGEKKALVYDNYSKLIAATDTIARMREKMDPLTPTTSTLGPAIRHIAGTAASLRRSGKPGDGGGDVGARKKGEEQATVRWVLDAPRRLRLLVEEGSREEAEREWREVERLLDRWKGVDGVEDVRKACLEALSKEEG